MEKIIIGFSSNQAPFSRLIRWATNSHISHVYIRIPVKEFGTDIIFQASKFSVHYEHYPRFLAYQEHIEEYEIDLTPEQARLGEWFRITEAGKPYSWAQILGFGWVLLNRKFNRRVTNPLSNKEVGYICVEAAGRCIFPKEDLDLETLTPEDILQYVKKEGRQIK